MNKSVYESALDKIKLSAELKDSAVEKLKLMQCADTHRLPDADKYNASDFRTADTVILENTNKCLKIVFASVIGGAALFACVFGAVKLSELYSDVPDVQIATTTVDKAAQVNADDAVTLSLDKTVYTAADEYGTLTISAGKNCAITPMFTSITTVMRYLSDDVWTSTGYSDLMVSAAFELKPGESMENTVFIRDIYRSYGAGKYRIEKNDVSGRSGEIYHIEFTITDENAEPLPEYTVGDYSNKSEHFTAVLLDDDNKAAECPSFGYGANRLTLWVKAHDSEGLSDDVSFVGETELLTRGVNGWHYSDTCNSTDSDTDSSSMLRTIRISAANGRLPVGEYILQKEIEGERVYVRFNITEADTPEYTALSGEELDVNFEVTGGEAENASIPIYTADSYSNHSANYAAAFVDNSGNYMVFRAK